jgi:beta-phosphoglucomutase
MIEAVVFDMDGVLIDAREWHYNALNYALEMFGASIGRDEHIDYFDGLPTRAKLEVLSGRGLIPYSLHGIINEVKQDMTFRMAAQHCYPNTAHLLMLNELKSIQGLHIGVATNSIRVTSESMLSLSGILPLLDTLVTNEDVKNAKPDPEIYLKACELLGVETGNTLVVEDNVHGIEAAKAAGCHVLQIADPSQLNLSVVMNEIGGLRGSND